MELLLPIQIPSLTPAISYLDRIYLVGSCFTEHITNFLHRAKFHTCQNAHGIIFNPISVCNSLLDVVQNKEYKSNELFYWQEYWHSWLHHSDFSSMNQDECLQKINTTIAIHHEYLKQATILVITLGSAFAYFHQEEKIYVSNNHRAPSQIFRKDLLSTSTISECLHAMQEQVLRLNPNIRFIYTISPVRHTRDGVIENNRSKARLIEAVHNMTNAYYFPSYELVIDVLRDYRFYDIDLVHPNYQATRYVWEQFELHCIDKSCYTSIRQFEQLAKAKLHKPKNTHSQAHKDFMALHLNISKELQAQHPYLDLQDEISYFSSTD